MIGGIFKSGGGKKSNFGKVGGAEKEDRKKETKILPHTLTYSILVTRTLSVLLTRLSAVSSGKS